MSLDKSRIPKRGNSSRKFIPEKQRKTMTDPFVDWIKRSRSDKGETVSGRMVETRSQKTSEEQKDVEADGQGPDLDQHEATWDRQGYTTTSDATRG